MKLYDCFMYNNEDQLLEVRLNILDKLVNKFIIVESLYDHQGRRKKLNFKINNFKKFKKKIRYLVIKKFPDGYNSWERENYNRNYLVKGLYDAKPNDYIMISDLDEIPKITNKKIFQEKKFTVFNQDMFYYKFNLLNTTEPKWLGSRACKKKYLLSPQWIRNKKIKRYPIWRLDKMINSYNWNIVEDGGWHFSFVMNSSKIREKIRSFAHAEFNKSEYIKVKSIKKNIALKKDLFDRKLNFIKIDDERKLPKYLLRNKHKYEELFI